MPIHSKMIFPPTGPWFAWVAKNRGATALEYGDAVAFWFKTTGDTTATTTTLWVRAASKFAGAGLFATQGNTNISLKVAGIVIGSSTIVGTNMGTVGQGDDAIVCWAGVVEQAAVTGIVGFGDTLKLSGAVGRLEGSVTYGNGAIVAMAMEQDTGNLARVFIAPWRQ